MTSHKFQDKLIILLGFIIWSLSFHFDLVTNLNSYYLGDFQDGVKNYFTLIYHVEQDSSYNHFEGLNYPYGEHVVFTDNQPLLSNTIKLFSTVFPALGLYTTGLMNGFMMLAWLLAALILNEILVFFTNKRNVHQALFALFIALLSPQIHRMAGHYALSYVFVLPLLWWQALLFFKQPSFLKSSLIGITIALSAGLHLYYLAICLAFLGLLWTFSFVSKPKESLQAITSLAHLGLQLILPLFLVALWISLFDEAEIRPKSPFGFLLYRARWEGIFLPIYKPIGSWIDSTIGIRPLRWETVAYVGIFATLSFLTLTTLSIKKVFQKQISINFNLLDRSLFASVLLLFFSLGFPFVFGAESLVEYLGPLKQFRGIGRFSWVFFFVMNVYGFVYLQIRMAKSWWLLLPILLVGYDAFTHHAQPFYQKNKIPELNSAMARNNHPLSKIETSDFQAIIPIPFYHTGSENFELACPSERILSESMVSSVVSGLPLVSVQLSRTDLMQSMNILKLVMATQEIPEAILDMKSVKDFLLVFDKSAEISPVQKHMIKSGNIFFENEEIAYLRLAYTYFENRIDGFANAALKRYNNDTINQSPLSFQDYEQYNNGGFKSKGSLEIDLSDWFVLDSLKQDTVDSIHLNYSFWFFAAQDGQAQTSFLLEGRNASNEVVVWERESWAKGIKTLNQDWALVSFDVTIKKNVNYKVLLKSERHKLNGQLDNLLIRASEDTVYQKKGNTIWENNQFYNVPKDNSK